MTQPGVTPATHRRRAGAGRPGSPSRSGRLRRLRGIDIQVMAGEVLAVMGPSGSGKSTLLHCLAGILPPDEGEVWFGAQRIDTLAEPRRSVLRRDQFGFVFQFGQLVPELPAIENVMLPLLLAGHGRAEARERSAALLGRLELGGLEQRRPGEMSGGEAQRVAVARALVHQPGVVFADEPTGSLDTLAGERVMELLTDCAREQNAAIVLVTHEARVAAYADREAVVRDGLIASLVSP